MADHDPRTVRAFALAPLAAPAAYAGVWLAVALVRSFSEGGSLLFGRGSAEMILATFAIGAPLAYAAMVVGGLPTYLALRHFGALNRWTLWAAAALIGAVVALLIAPQLRGDLFSVPFPWWAGAVLGVITAEVFVRLGGVRRA